MPAPLPASGTRNPLILPDATAHPGTVFLAAAIDHPRWEVGAYSYASADVPPEDWAMALAPYLHPMQAEGLTIGRFCQIAQGVEFLEGANHRRDGFSSYPFFIFTGFGADRASMPAPGPGTEIGHDVWIGRDAKILPGARIGSGCIVGAGAVAGGRLPPYSVVAGNPGRVVRRRFDGATIAALLEIAWWDWPPEQILAAEAAICGGDLAALRAAAEG
ncbi:CatB-related O-acetyltransferase [Histidinibacterium lentulum]|uniref:Antibiotic acetyltransferase n=1 Tax=Histidinibacterium lentulum TaxID=2480588 RepID=A0A3N2R5A1_9RHOB|nr:CatB-related O-acetyltransferase [Histidinibacterium lentulum]ROU02675.1 antibiotic acetyltransferase [Histidinibacterium lentulum]